MDLADPEMMKMGAGVNSSSAKSPKVSAEARSSEERGGNRLPSRGERGSALVEFAMAMAFLLIVLVVGLAGFAFYLNNYLALQNAVSAGTRVLASSRSINTDPCTPTINAITNVYKSSAVESATPTLSVSIELNSGTDGPYTSACTGTATTGPPSYLIQGTYVTVTATHTTQSIFKYGSFPIKAQAREIVQ